VGILVTFVPPKVTARRGMSDMPPRGTAVTHKPLCRGRQYVQYQAKTSAAAAKHNGTA